MAKNTVYLAISWILKRTETECLMSNQKATGYYAS